MPKSADDISQDEPDRNDAVAAEFERAHPEAAALLRQRGIEAERERVTHHLDAGAASPLAREIAEGYIRSGQHFDAVAALQYVDCAKRSSFIEQRQRESDADERALATAGVAGPPDMGDQVVAAMSPRGGRSFVRP